MLLSARVSSNLVSRNADGPCNSTTELLHGKHEPVSNENHLVVWGITLPSYIYMGIAINNY